VDEFWNDQRFRTGEHLIDHVMQATIVDSHASSDWRKVAVHPWLIGTLREFR
jgi:hypothetical protein